MIVSWYFWCISCLSVIPLLFGVPLYGLKNCVPSLQCRLSGSFYMESCNCTQLHLLCLLCPLDEPKDAMFFIHPSHSLRNPLKPPTDHVSSLLASCSNLLYAPASTQMSWLDDQSLKDVFHTTVIGKLTYCAAAWHGFCSTADYVRLESFFVLLCKVRLC